MSGMRKVPDGVHRVRASAERPARWYDVWLTLADRCVLVGQTKRLDRHLMHRAFPVSGETCREFRGWVSAVEWLVGIWRGHEATSDHSRAAETEKVTPV